MPRQELLLHSLALRAHHHLQRPAAGAADRRTSTRSCRDPDVMSALCLVHQRFSTNTFPTWQLAHPFRYIAHNGEINTVRGNVNWMHARQSILASPLFGDDIKKLFPVIQPGGSDSASLRQRGRTAGAGRPLAAARDGDADPRSVGRRIQHMNPREAGVLRISRLADGAVGRPRRDRLHRRPRRSARRSTATACARRATWSPTTTW